MNVFDVVFRNALAKEVVFSSVFNFLLDKNESHGMGSLFLDRLLDAVPNDDLVGDLRATFTEWESVEPEKDLGPRVGRVDSLLSMRNQSGDRTLWIATEVKIVDASAKNITEEGTQVARYVRAIAAERGTDFLFLYLVPSSESRYAIGQFQATMEKLPREQRDRCFLLFWKTGNGSPSDRKHTCTASVEEILRDVLRKDGEGLITPLSTEVRLVLKSLVQTVRLDFNRPVETYEPGRFPDRSEYLAGLPESHRELYEFLEELTGGRRRVSTANTSIGFPFTNRPEKGAHNTLFRVLTMTRYSKQANEIGESDYARTLIIECDDEVYPSQEFWNGVKTQFSGVATVEHGKVHPNESGKERAVWLVFNADLPQAELNHVKEALASFVEASRKEFDAWATSTSVMKAGGTEG